MKKLYPIINSDGVFDAVELAEAAPLYRLPTIGRSRKNYVDVHYEDYTRETYEFSLPPLFSAKKGFYKHRRARIDVYVSEKFYAGMEDRKENLERYVRMNAAWLFTYGVRNEYEFLY